MVRALVFPINMKTLMLRANAQLALVRKMIGLNLTLGSLVTAFISSCSIYAIASGTAKTNGPVYLYLDLRYTRHHTGRFESERLVLPHFLIELLSRLTRLIDYSWGTVNWKDRRIWQTQRHCWYLKQCSRRHAMGCWVVCQLIMPYLPYSSIWSHNSYFIHNSGGLWLNSRLLKYLNTCTQSLHLHGHTSSSQRYPCEWHVMLSASDVV